MRKILVGLAVLISLVGLAACKPTVKEPEGGIDLIPIVPAEPIKPESDFKEKENVRDMIKKNGVTSTKIVDFKEAIEKGYTRVSIEVNAIGNYDNPVIFSKVALDGSEIQFKDAGLPSRGSNNGHFNGVKTIPWGDDKLEVLLHGATHGSNGFALYGGNVNGVALFEFDITDRIDMEFDFKINTANQLNWVSEINIVFKK